MPTDPASIPHHVVMEADAQMTGRPCQLELAAAIAAALDALMDDRLVRVPLGAYYEHVRLSDVLAAALEGGAQGTVCTTADCQNPATCLMTCEGEGAFPYCDSCEADLAPHERHVGSVR